MKKVKRVVEFIIVALVAIVLLDALGFIDIKFNNEIVTTVTDGITKDNEENDLRLIIATPTTQVQQDSEASSNSTPRQQQATTSKEVLPTVTPITETQAEDRQAEKPSRD